LEGPEERDRELENLLGQFLVASFQSEKLAELITEKLSFRNTPKEMRMILRSSTSSRPPLLVTLRVEPYRPRREDFEKKEQGSYKILCILESPELNISVAKAKNDVESIMQGSFEWWSGQGQYSHLKLDDWVISTVAVSSETSSQIKEIYRIVHSIEARRKQEP
jgi:mannose/fructose/N-acetylgalactosamine-specific phosphotransferase system component IIB